MLLFLTIGLLGAALLVVAVVLDGIFDGILEIFGGGGNTLFSGPAIGAFGSAFGFGGALAWNASDGSVALSIGAGLGAGLTLAVLIGIVTSSLLKSPTDATPTAGDTIGLPGVVVSAIPDNGMGQITVRLGGQPVKLNAQSTTALPAGTAVTVTSELSPTLVTVTSAAHATGNQ